jgi:predicted ATP-binding protein involved in virulence
MVKFNQNESYLNPKRENYIFSFLKAMRTVQTEKVTTIVNDENLKSEFRKDKSSDFFISKFKQYLVNKKVGQAFDQIKGNTEGVKSKGHFFERLEKVLKNFYEDDSLKLIFEEKNYEFYINLKNNRQITFNQLPDGFASFTSILMDLYIRLDIIQSNLGDYTYDPCGIVLLDEPETHLHIKAQYEVLPILTEFFPNVQFIVATHSPAVISSIKNTTIYDLTSKQSITDEVVGSSFSELMVTHFGLDNEFSPIADAIIDNVEKAVKETKTNKPLLKQKLQEILSGNERYLSPTLRLELESLILENS